MVNDRLRISKNLQAEPRATQTWDDLPIKLPNARLWVGSPRVSRPVCGLVFTTPNLGAGPRQAFVWDRGNISPNYGISLNSNIITDSIGSQSNRPLQAWLTIIIYH